ncbi:MAG: hypothetical protein H8E66_06230 [Planctomycetes bacterium]|nr:hypothetical protein [Planctomycetota bacterium]
MRRNSSWIIFAAAVFGFVCLAQAAAPGPVIEVRQIEQEELTELGDAVARVDLYRDNFYQYEARVEQLTAAAIAMEGGTVEVLLTVRRVTAGEVLVEALDAGRTRMILKHAAPPFFGNRGTVWYYAQPSADYWNMLAKPVGLRIGDEISLEMAKGLRKRDVLRVSGRVASMPIRVKGVFEPHVAAVVTDWKVVEAIVDADAEEARY